MKCIRMLTFLPIEEIEAMESWDASRINEKKALLAYNVTELVHGAEEAKKAEATALALFSGEGDDANMPHTEITADMIVDGRIGIIDLLIAGKLAPSRGEARRLIEQGGISVDGEKVTDFAYAVSADALTAGIKVKKGKKIFHKFSLQ